MHLSQGFVDLLWKCAGTTRLFTSYKWECEYGGSKACGWRFAGSVLCGCTGTLPEVKVTSLFLSEHLNSSGLLALVVRVVAL